MTDQINDQISAFIDNELSADESALLVRRFERDTESRARAMRYTLIGASLRGELLEPHPSVLRQRVAAALSGAAPAAPKARERIDERFAKPLLGVAIAATVAIVAVGALRWLNETAPTPDVARGVAAALPVVEASSLQARDTIVAPSYVVPRNIEDQSQTVAPIRLTNYLMHHGEYASGFTRTAVNSNVVGAAMEPVVFDTAVAKPVAVEQEGLGK
jgi:sigma-E factor negative regulatory protein RseA